MLSLTAGGSHRQVLRVGHFEKDRKLVAADPRHLAARAGVPEAGLRCR